MHQLLLFSYEITNLFAWAACTEIDLTVDAPIRMPPSALRWCLLIGIGKPPPVGSVVRWWM